MRPASGFSPHETFEQMRQRMLDDAARFIEWGLRNPDKVPRIPRHAVGAGNHGFSERFGRVFWSIALRGEGPASK